MPYSPSPIISSIRPTLWSVYARCSRLHLTGETYLREILQFNSGHSWFAPWFAGLLHFQIQNHIFIYQMQIADFHPDCQIIYFCRSQSVWEVILKTFPNETTQKTDFFNPTHKWKSSPTISWRGRIFPTKGQNCGFGRNVGVSSSGQLQLPLILPARLPGCRCYVDPTYCLDATSVGKLPRYKYWNTQIKKDRTTEIHKYTTAQ